MAIEKSAGQRFLEDKLTEHPNVKGFFDVIGSIIGFFLGGHFLVWLGQKLIFTAGYVAETVLLFATLWVTSEYVAGKWINALPFMPANLPDSLNSLSIMAFSLLPELILFSAIVTTFRHWWITWHQSTISSKIGSGVWAVLYTIPTIIFLAMTCVTLHSLSTAGGNIVEAGTNTIQIRSLAGWVYALIEMIYPSINKVMSTPEPKTQTGVDSQQASVDTSVDTALECVDTSADKAEIERLTKLVETLAGAVQQTNVTITEITQTVNQFTQNVNFIHSGEPLALPEAGMSTVNQSVDTTCIQVSTPVHLSVDSKNKAHHLLAMAHTQTVDEPAISTIDEAITSDQNDAERPLQGDGVASIVYPDVPGISAQMVKQIIDAHTAGESWRSIASTMSKNYSRIVKPVKDAYEQSLSTDVYTSVDSVDSDVDTCIQEGQTVSTPEQKVQTDELECIQVASLTQTGV